MARRALHCSGQPASSLRASATMRPPTMALVVAIAWMMLPAMPCAAGETLLIMYMSAHIAVHGMSCLFSIYGLSLTDSCTQGRPWIVQNGRHCGFLNPGFPGLLGCSHP